MSLTKKRFSPFLKPDKNFFTNLISKGSITPVNPAKEVDPANIPWIDYDLLSKGREFVKFNYATLLLSGILADTIGFVSRQVATTLFYRNFYPENVCGARFLSTFHTSMTKWLLSDFKGTEFIQAIQRVQKLHKIYAQTPPTRTVPPPNIQYPPEYKKLAEIIRHDMRHVSTEFYPADLISWSPVNYFTQLDVALVQFGISTLLLFPEKMGVSTKFETDETMRGYFHMWAVIGRLLGLEDEFNLALHPDRELYMEIVEKIGIPSFKMVDETSIFCMHKMMDGVVSVMMPGLITIKSLWYFSLETLGIEGVELWSSMSLRDKICYYHVNFSMYLMQFDFVRVAVNLMSQGLSGFLVYFFLNKK